MFEEVVVTDSVPPFRLTNSFVEKRLAVLDAAAFFALAIERLHAGDSIVELIAMPE